MKFPHGLEEIIRTYGDPEPYIIRDGARAGQVSDEWRARILAPVDVPWTGLVYDTGLPDKPGKPRLVPVRTIWCHKVLAPELASTLREVRDKGLHTTIQRWGGCYNWRAIRGDLSTLSTHAWGISLDLDPHEDPLGDTKIDQDMRLVKLMEDRGWTWGGRFRRKDGMHYQGASGY